MERFEEILEGLKERILYGHKDNPPETISIFSDDLTAIGNGVLGIALSSCELAPKRSELLFDARQKMEFGRLGIEQLFDNKVSCIPSYNGNQRGFVIVTYQNGGEARIKI